MDREEISDEQNVNEVFPVNPIQEKDTQIAILEKQIEALKVEASEVPNLKEDMTKITKDLNPEAL